ncbi:MAG: GTPase Era, partial [Candidatus Binatia bacterium]
MRCGTATLAGRPNVGKSTLLNAILGVKIAIVSDKPQTTRSRILGVRTRPGAQTLWVDTPGIHQARGRFNRRMVDTAERSIHEADVVVAVVDVESARNGLAAADRALLAKVAASRRPWLVALNKIDRRSKSALLPLLDAVGREFPAIDLVPVSALEGRNVAELERAVAALLPPGRAVYPEDELTDQTARAITQEFIREQVFGAVRAEIPYQTAVRIDVFTEKANVNVVSATILVERDSQKRIVIGAGGATVRAIGKRAREELERFFDKRFYL